MWNKQKEGNVLETLDLSVNKTSQIVCVCVCALKCLRDRFVVFGLVFVLYLANC